MILLLYFNVSLWPHRSHVIFGLKLICLPSYLTLLMFFFTWMGLPRGPVYIGFQTHNILNTGPSLLCMLLHHLRYKGSSPVLWCQDLCIVSWVFYCSLECHSLIPYYITILFSSVMIVLSLCQGHISAP